MGKPDGGKAPSPESEYIGLRSYTRGSGTSQYPEEEKTISDSVSSGERTRNSLNQPACRLGLRDYDMRLE